MPSITRVDVDCYTSSASVTCCGAISNIEAKEYYTVTLYDKQTLKETNVDVYVGKPYKIIFYNQEKGGVSKVTGKIIRMDGANITIESITAIDDWVCLCEHRRYLNEVVKIYTAAIPVSNVYSIEPINEEDLLYPPRPKERTVTIVGVLGLSAEVIRSVVVRLRVYSDDRAPTYEAVPVDMTLNNVYKVSYFNRKDGSMYEITGRLVDIQEVFKFTADNQMNGFVRDEVSPPPHETGDEILGYGNTIYDRDHFFGLKKDNTEGERIYFVFDSSEDFSGMYDRVWLKDIRNVELVKEDDETPSEDDSNEDISEDTNNCPFSRHCPILHHKKDYDINEDFSEQANWDHPMPPPPPYPNPWVSRPYPKPVVYICPKDNINVESCNCEDCENVENCEAFLAFCSDG